MHREKERFAPEMARWFDYLACRKNYGRTSGDYRIAATVRSCEINHGGFGGDFFEVVPYPDGRTGFLLIDACGKNYTSSRIGIVTIKLLHEILRKKPNDSPEKTLRAVNNALLGQAASFGRFSFVTGLYAVVSPETPIIQMTRAGHTMPFIIDARGQKIAIPLETSLPFNVMKNASLQTFDLLMRPGDSLIIYSDGITECLNEQEKLWGIGKFSDVLAEAFCLTPEEILSHVVRKMAEYRQSQPPSDDASLLIIQKNRV